jgi:SAM-dependent MidA family methyltransferase
VTPVEELLAERIRAAGRITFAEFMELALYAPGVGYYRRPDRISARGDFYTSPEVHPAFGALICVQLREMWSRLKRPEEFRVVEFGSGAGTLARDIAAYAPRLDARFADCLAYTAIDRARPAAESTVPDRTTRASQTGPRVGCVLSNELLDAFPVHRFVIERGRVQEMYVHMSRGRFCESPGEPSSPLIEERLAGLRRRLPDGFRGEVCIRLDAWAAGVASDLDRGFVITIDFGHDRDVLYAPERAGGTIRCYYRHTANSDPFRHAGDQDISAQVDFTAVDDALRREGILHIGATTQREFLTRLGARDFISRLRQECHSTTEVARNRTAMLELLKPEGLGAFRVAIHAKGVNGDADVALDRSPTGHLPVPLLDPADDRVPVLEGRYPHLSGELTGSWDPPTP